MSCPTRIKKLVSSQRVIAYDKQKRMLGFFFKMLNSTIIYNTTKRTIAKIENEKNKRKMIQMVLRL